jgi:hypothetical protein
MIFWKSRISRFFAGDSAADDLFAFDFFAFDFFDFFFFFGGGEEEEEEEEEEDEEDDDDDDEGAAPPPSDRLAIFLISNSLIHRFVFVVIVRLVLYCTVICVI